jgi:hypothetical protein
LQTALHGQIRDELAERPDRRFAVGERVVIRRLPETTTEDGERKYRPFRVYFPDRPELDIATEFGLDQPSHPTPESERTEEPSATGGSDALDDDIPF